ncbi:MAG: amino acid ABC transporter permease [Eubacteriales bacterium]|nr:amino acid ABC transporter permease [Eubacteriales bacterium]
MVTFQILPYLLEGTLKALQIFVLTLIFAVPLGIIVARLRQSTLKIIQLPIRFYLLIMRGTPLILQLIFFMYFPPFILNFPIDRFLAVILAFSLNYAAYFAEIFRGGLESIPRGQFEAGHVLGFSSGQTFTRIVLPQVIKRILPPSASEAMTLIKDTALAQIIGVAELFRAAQNSTSRLVSIEPIIAAGIIYLVLNSLVAIVFNRFEKKLSYYRH